MVFSSSSNLFWTKLLTKRHFPFLHKGLLVFGKMYIYFNHVNFDHVYSFHKHFIKNKPFVFRVPNFFPLAFIVVIKFLKVLYL